jgi:ABC-type transport system substrate-binding protein
MAREHEESEAATTQLMGSGAFLFENTEAPVISRFKRNPDYFNSPLPYFDEVHMLGTADFAKRFADFSAGNVHITYWHAAEERDQLQSARPEAQKFEHFYAGYNVIMRVDQVPFNDDRVRKALSMAIDRQALRDATGAGEGEDDQAFSWTVDTWGFSKPSELGEAAKYWEYNVAEAKKMLAAANAEGFSTKMAHWDPSVIGQAYVDQAVLIQTQWRNNLGIEVEDVSQQFAPLFSTAVAGNYDGTYFFPGGGGVISPAPGIAFRNGIWSPPEGVTAPTQNSGHINDAELSAAADKQSTQLDLTERQQTFKVMEDIMANQMYRITTSTFTTTYFGDEKLQDCQMPITATNSALAGVKYWWFKS